MTTAADVLEKLMQKQAESLSREEAQERLRNIGILDQRNRVAEKYRDMIVAARKKHGRD